MSERLKDAQRVVVKVGSSLLVDYETGRVRRGWLASLAEDIAVLKSNGADVLVVSSGAIAIGRSMLGLPAKSLKLEENQAAAAVGQIELAHAWQQKLEELRTEHRDLDDVIARVAEEAPFDQIRIQRLKKRKLMLRDEITRIENILLPDIIA